MGVKCLLTGKMIHLPHDSMRTFDFLFQTGTGTYLVQNRTFQNVLYLKKIEPGINQQCAMYCKAYKYMDRRLNINYLSSQLAVFLWKLSISRKMLFSQ